MDGTVTFTSCNIYHNMASYGGGVAGGGGTVTFTNCVSLPEEEEWHRHRYSPTATFTTIRSERGGGVTVMPKQV